MDAKRATAFFAFVVGITLLNVFIALHPDVRVYVNENGEPVVKEECIAVVKFAYPPRVEGAVKVDDFYHELFEQEVAYVSDGSPISHTVVKLTMKPSPVWYNAHSYELKPLYNDAYPVWIAPKMSKALSHPYERIEMGGMNVFFDRENLTVYSEPVGGIK